jgi:hypothetical protein
MAVGIGTRETTSLRRCSARRARHERLLLLLVLLLFVLVGLDVDRALAQASPPGEGRVAAGEPSGKRARDRKRKRRASRGKKARKGKKARRGEAPRTALQEASDDAEKAAARRSARLRRARRARRARARARRQAAAAARAERSLEASDVALTDGVADATTGASTLFGALEIETTPAPPLEAPPARIRPRPARKAAPRAGENAGDGSGVITREFIALQKDGTRLYRRRTSAARRRSDIRVDGVLDEAAWQGAPRTRMSWKQRPDEGGHIIGETDFRVLYDDDGLYVGVHLIDPQPEQIRAILYRGVGFDKIPQSDWIGVWLDPTTSRRSGYVFLVNPVGVKLDQRLVDDATFEDAYDAVWEAKTSRDRTGWYAEYRIPFSQLRLNNGYQRAWGFQMARRFARNQEFHTWSPSPVTSGRLVSAFGDLEIEDRIDVGRAFEFLPYLLGGVRIEEIPGEDRLNETVGPEYGIGTDFKLSVTDSLKLTGAVNPDFGQVEADPSEVNLTDRETFFTERRPLFVSDNELYQFGIGRGSENLFYSRRIGARPHFSQAGAAPYIDEPDVTTIYGAAKLSGQLPGEFTLGLMSAIAGEEQSRAQLDTGEVDEQVIEPLTSYNVAQLGRTFRDGSSDLRLAMTGVNRFLDGTGIDTLHRQAYTGGAHYLHKFADNEWAVFGRVAGSYVAGDRAALLFTQQASQRYYQRPDADHLELDPTRTSLSGLSFKGQVEKASGTWKGVAGVDGRSPGFEANDVGFLLDADVLNPWISVDHDRWVAGEWVKQLFVSGSVESFADWAPELLRHRANLEATVTQANDASVGMFGSYTRELLDTKLLRGGPAVAGVDSIVGQVFYQTATKRALHLRLQGDSTLRPASSSWLLGGALTVTWHILSNLELSLAPGYVRNRNDNQYVATVSDAMEQPRYVLGRIDQTTLRATTRLNYTLSPRMSLQLYAEPFVSAGRYNRFKEPAELRSSSYGARYAELPAGGVVEEMGELQVDADQDGMVDFAFPQPDFKVSALLSNLVYRWEYMPGSTLYFIWSQAGSARDADGTIRSADVGDVFSNQAAHVLLVKLSYWWNP